MQMTSSCSPLDISDSCQKSPDSLTLITTPIRGCGHTNENHLMCDSVIYLPHGCTHACGRRILAYQTGWASAFYNSITQN